MNSEMLRFDDRDAVRNTVDGGRILGPHNCDM